jgi:hypothetical protein
MRTRPGSIEPEIYFRIIHGVIQGQNPAPVASCREQRGEIALGPKGAFENGNIGALTRQVAALRWHGDRSKNCNLVFQCLQHTFGLGPEHWRVLALCHERRNAAEYAEDFNVDEKLMVELLKVIDPVLLSGPASIQQ